MSRPIERRTATLSDVQHRAKDEFTVEFTGYASVFDSRTDIRDHLGVYGERIRPGAFRRAIGERQSVPLLFDHAGMPVARYPGTMRLSEDAHGLKVEATLDRRQTLANDLAIALERGDLSKMSFAFAAVGEEWSKDYSEREVTDADLFDVAVVGRPAYDDTSAGVAESGSLVRAERIVADDRAGKVLSGANSDLVGKARKALAQADAHLKNVQAAAKPKPKPAPEDKGNGNGDTNASGLDSDQGGAGSPGSGNPIMPQDGAGARSLAAYEAECRSSFTVAELKVMGKAGEAFDNGDGTFGYPTPTLIWLKKAIKAVGRLSPNLPVHRIVMQR